MKLELLVAEENMDKPTNTHNSCFKSIDNLESWVQTHDKQPFVCLFDKCMSVFSLHYVLKCDIMLIVRSVRAF